MSADEAAATLGARIRAFRRARGLTQDRLASFTGVSRSAVAQWESDRTGHSAGMLRRIAEALGVSVGMLRDGWDAVEDPRSLLTPQESALLALYRRCSDPDQAVLMHVAEKIAASSRLD
ncbi:MAG: helix-turn-helix domain-containing protein [Gluconacetobacter diazotrophicus]|nr:helix-turn-helix domain-containing protein [Gluconacetobacter diazotrophicus]